MDIIVASFAAILTSAIFLQLLVRITKSMGMVRENFAGTSIPVGAGLAFSLGLAAGSIVYVAMGNGSAWYLLPGFTVLLFGVLGFIDDRWGDRSIGGFSGHIGALLKGNLTTGAVKALGGGMIALLFAFTVIPLIDPDVGILRLLLDAALIALASNTFNLFDLRPARAQKVFLVLLVVLIAVGATSLADMLSGPGISSYWVLAVAATLPLFLGDLRARFMLGDSGSNAIGAAIGVGLAGMLGTPALIAVVAVMLLIHWYGEVHSITKLIEATPGLRQFDELGRKH